MSRPPGETALRPLLRHLSPRLDPRLYVYAEAADPAPALLAKAWALVREAEGTTLILAVEDAAAAGLEAVFPCRRIVLEVESSLEAVGMMAAVATALAAAGVPANVVAGLRHDHLLVPEGKAEAAMAALASLA